MVSLGKVASNNGTSGYVQMFGLMNPPTGAQTVAVTVSATSTISGGSTSFTGVAGFSTAVTAFGSSAAPAVAITGTNAGNMIVDAVCTGTLITSSTHTNRWLKNTNTSTAAGAGAGSTAASAVGSVTMQYAVTSDFWGIIAVEVQQYVLPVNAISAVGSFVSATGTSLVTLSVNPTRVGDAMFFTMSYISSGSVTGVSGGGCPASGSGLPGAWTKIAGPFTAFSGSAAITMWMGTVATTGSSTITATGTTLTNTQRLCCQQCTSGGGPGIVWALDGAAGTKTNASSATVAFPTLVPSGLLRMYIGYGLNANTASAPTSGYTLNNDPGGNPFIFDTNVSTSQSPTCTQTAGLSGAIAALVTATNPTAQFMPFFM